MQNYSLTNIMESSTNPKQEQETLLQQKPLIITSLLMLIVLPATVLPSFFRLIDNTLPAISFGTLVLTLIFQLTMLVLFYLINHRYRSNVIERDDNEDYGFGWSLKTWYIVFAVVALLGLIIQQLFSSVSDVETSSVYENLINSPADIILILIAATIMAPIVEELVFRKFLMDRFEAVMGAGQALILSSLLFSMIHWLDDILGSSLDFTISHMLSTFILGVFLGYMYQKTGNIKYPIIIHGINNFIGFFRLIIGILLPYTGEELDNFLGGNTNTISQEARTNIVTVLIIDITIAVLLIIALIWAIVRLFKNRSAYFQNFKEAISTLGNVVFKDHVGVVIYALLGFVLLPLIVVLFILPITSEISASFVSNIGYLAVIAFAIYHINSIDRKE